MGFWDDGDLKVGGSYVKFDNEGDSVAGTITAIRKHRFEDGSVAPQILLTTDDGEDKTLTAGQVQLKTKLAEQRPDVGDHLAVTYVRKEKRASNKTLKHFEVVVKRGDGDEKPPF